MVKKIKAGTAPKRRPKEEKLKLHIVQDLRPLAVPIDSIQRDPDNVNTHDDEQVDLILSLIRTYGQRKPIIVNRRTNLIEAGNGTHAAMERGRMKSIAVVWVDDTDQVAAGYSVGDNQSARRSKWDLLRLRKQLEKLEQNGKPRTLFGFGEDEFRQTIADADTNKTLLDQAIQLVPTKEYVVVMCENLDEWGQLKVALKLPQVRRGGYRAGSQFDAVGTQRVVKAEALLKLIGGKHAHSDTK